jgi:hypothetical protein
MKSKSSRDLGDIDTMYISEDRTLLVLLERKRSKSASAFKSTELIDQVHATKEALMDPETVFSVPFVWKVLWSAARSRWLASIFNGR